MAGSKLYWLPDPPAWNEAINALTDAADPWTSLGRLAQYRLDFVKTAKLDKLLQQHFGAAPPAGLTTRPIRLAVLSSATVEHLVPAIRVAALRRNLWCTTYTPAYGQYRQEILNPRSSLHAFSPTAVLLSLDARHLVGAIPLTADPAEVEAKIVDLVDDLRRMWHQTREHFGCSVIQQTVLPVYPAILGANEHRLPASPARSIFQINQRLRMAADDDGVDLLTLDARTRTDGMDAWYDPMLWHRAKQEISVQAAPFFGDLVGRLLAARQGRSFKCLAIDLDNTLWGGVIGDDGLEGIVLGQGSALGEAHLAFQEYVQQLARRGIIIAVCSKNEQATALSAFESHPDMLLKRSDIAAFVANWSDKPTNLRRIAEQLNIGLDSVVFADDNPFERAIVRRELPMVAVPELPEDPALFARCIADAGYFESVAVTSEDFQRTALYQNNAARESLLASATDMEGYLKSLRMQLRWQSFDRSGMQRIMQLINKTNQFNLTTRRYTESDIVAIESVPRNITLQCRLLDTLGDNGMICVVIAKPMNDESDALIDTWLMSCRVLGRGVEQATLNLLAEQARSQGFERLIGEYRPTSKNGMVAGHFRSLGFDLLCAEPDGRTFWTLSLAQFKPFETAIETVRVDP